MIAIIQTGGKQYKVAEGDKLKVEKIDIEIGEVVKFPALFIGDENTANVGTPTLKSTIEGKVIAQGKSKKVTGIRHKAKKRELTRYGHRQAYTEIEIARISA